VSATVGAGLLLAWAGYFETRLIARGVRLLNDCRCSLGFAFIGRALVVLAPLELGECQGVGKVILDGDRGDRDTPVMGG
jgi:hypothetical protein